MLNLSHGEGMVIKVGYNPKFFVEAEAEIKSRKLNNEALTEKKRNDFAKTCPEYDVLRRKIANTGTKLYEIFFNGNVNIKEEVKRLEADNLRYNAEIEELLIKNGYRINYLADIYSCEKCKDSGIYNNRRCDCFMDIVKRLSSAQFNKNSQIKLSDFHSFDLNYYNDEKDKSSGYNIKKVMAHNLGFCKDYAENFHLPTDGILMRGKTGLGKTHLSLAIANEVINKGYSVIYGSVSNLFRKIEQEHFGRENQNDKGSMDTFASVDLLILDDLGTEFDSQFYISTFYNLLNSRLNAGFPTIINTNLELPELKQRYGDHIMSRILTMDCLVFYGNDIRMSRKHGIKG